MALAALDSGIMTPFALENVELYNKYGSVEAAVAAGKEFHMWAKPFVDSYIYLGGTGSTLGLIIAIFIASRREDYRRSPNWRRRPAFSRSTNRFCSACR